jgi:hypothetical protein
MPRLLASTAALLLLFIGSVASASAAELTVEEKPEGVTVKIDGQPFAEYLIKSGSKPIVWPIYGPTGKLMTRSWPMDDSVAAEKDRDHPHQRSLWFTHGDVNGIDFWSEGKGRIVHREFVKVQGGPEATIVTKNDWRSPNDNTKLLEDERTFVFGGDADKRWIDVTVSLTAANDPVVFGDTKEGSFGVRVPSSMRVESFKGGKIVNSDGKENLAAWGKPAAWVDYHGPVEDEALGIAILNHPSSFRFPTHWHVRTYGLFAANPFGLSDFTGGKEKGQYTLPPGETMKLRYRVLLHKGDEKQGAVAEAFQEFSK